MKTNSTKLLAIARSFLTQYKHSWQLWLGVCTVVVLCVGTSTAALMFIKAQTPSEAAQTETTKISDEKKRTDSPKNSSSSSSNGGENTVTPDTTPSNTAQPTNPSNPSGSTSPGKSTPSSKPSGSSSSKPATGSTSQPTTPVTPPTTPTAPVVTSPSGQAVPRGDFGTWKQIFYDDFTKDAALGSWGEDWNAEKIVYTGAQGQQWRIPKELC